MTKDERIQAELARLMKIYQDLPENTLEVMLPLIQNAAFMKVTMDDLQEEIKENGAVETYQNGANQSGRKQAAAMQAYNQTIRNYNNAIKALSAKMPVTSVKYVPLKPEKTPEEIQAQRVESERRNIKTDMQIAEAHLIQLDGWRREGRITKEKYKEEAEAAKARMEALKRKLWELDYPEG